MGSDEVLEIFSGREGDAYWCRHCPVTKAPKAKPLLVHNGRARDTPHVKGLSRFIRCATWCAHLGPMPKFDGSHEIRSLDHDDPLVLAVILMGDAIVQRLQHHLLIVSRDLMRQQFVTGNRRSWMLWMR